MSQYDYDVIVVGSGMSGGIAAKEFCEKGYKTLVLERGKDLEHRRYKTEGKAPWEMESRGRISDKDRDENWSINKHCYALNEYTKHYFLNDRENPYIQEKPFHWIRSDMVGGKSLLWARQSYRWNKMDFEANAKDGHGIPWPIGYDDIEPWYDYIEPFVGISGSEEGLSVLPDGKFLPPHPLNIAEREVKEKLEKAFPNRKLIPARVAHLTKPQPIHTELGRGQCLARNQCYRGCSWGGYYSSVAGGLEAAKRTGNMTLTANAEVLEVLYDEDKGLATGVRYINKLSKEVMEVSAKVVFMCASTLGTVKILLNSTSKKFPNGIGNSSNVLGHYITDHVGGSGASGKVPGHLDTYFKGRRPGGVYIPRFRNLSDNEDNQYLRGYGYQGGANRESWHHTMDRDGIGADLKESFRTPNDWHIGIYGFGEMLPRYENHVRLHPQEKDQWGMPLLITDVGHTENEFRMQADMEKCAVEMLEASGVENIQSTNSGSTPGILIHEMGGACMGADAKTSYLNKWNQCHEVDNLFVTDGSAFPSQSCVNPSITFMAFTARAVDYAVKQIKVGNI